LNFIPKIVYTEILDGQLKEFTFDSPPEGDPFDETISVSSVVTKSNNGRKQTQFNYLEKTYSFEFIFQSEATKQAFVDFITRHAFRGGSFDYYPSSDELDFETFTIDVKSVSFSRPIPTAITGEFEYDFSFGVERVLNVV
jgi:uncharacterized protein Veg